MARQVVFDSPVRLAARREASRSPWEVGIRYAAAYACTLVAVAASRLALRLDVVLLLAALTVAGLPLSLWLRRARAAGLLRVGGRPIPRPWINAGVMAATAGVCSLVLALSEEPVDLSRLLDLASATLTVRLLMQAFLVFGVCRCLAILNEKDAVLCTVPSFSVLLLLIVINKGTEVVAFFVLWAVASAVLLCLDFRHDVRHACSASVSGLAPNQELKLSARGLATVLGFSLSGAAILSFSLAGDDQAGPDESWISTLATRLHSFSVEASDVSGSSGPERQIDFTSPPSALNHTPLWSVSLQSLASRKPPRPQYWRMFSLSEYDGRTWSQANGAGKDLQIRRAAQPNSLGPTRAQGPRSRYSFFSQIRRVEGLVYDVAGSGFQQARAPYFGAGAAPAASTSGEVRRGARPQAARARAARVRQVVRALVANTGFLPVLPGVTAMRFQDMSREVAVRERADGSLDVNVMQRDAVAGVQSEVPSLPEYGFAQGSRPPSEKIENPRLALTPAEEKRYLSLPASLPARVRDWTRAALKEAGPRESNTRRARRLLVALQSGSFYTLSPPLVPVERDATDFFLFESRRGYCTYFAGALAATTRAAGIPSRVVSGFTNPKWLESPFDEISMAELNEAGSHAWVEVWEPGWGWALLDPTPPESRGNNAPSLFQSWENLRSLAGEFIARHLAHARLDLPLAGAALLALALSVLRRRRLLKVLHAQAPGAASREDASARAEVAVLFARASRRLSRRFRPRAPWETTGEWLEASREVVRLRDEEPLRILFELYALSRFSPRPLSASHARAAREAAARLNWARVEKPEKAREEAPASTSGA